MGLKENMEKHNTTTTRLRAVGSFLMLVHAKIGLRINLVLLVVTSRVQ